MDMTPLDPSPDDAGDADRALARFVPMFAGHTVLVLGDIMLDRYVTGDVRRISPEAPIPVLRAAGRSAVLGGAANVAQNVAALGAFAVLIGVVGQDDASHAIEALLAASGHVTGRLVRAPERPTTVKTRFMAGSHQLLRLDEEDASAIDAATETALLAAFASAVALVDVVVLSDYAKGVLTDRVLEQAISLARAAGKPVVADPKRATFDAYRHASVLTPNELEVTKAAGFAVHDDATAVAAGLAALAQAQADAVLVTRSEKGMTLVRPGLEPLHVPTRARAVADVSGAGDTAAATLAVMLACGASLPEAAMMANIAAGISVGKPGSATVSRDELVEVMHEREVLAIDHKVVDLETALARIAAWRGQGLRVGFTNGCFDLIHPGHVRMLHKSRAACDRLVVGLNSDESVRRLKGPTRPVQTEAARATVMASIASSDLVILFGEDTPERLIHAIRPDRLFKGADYRLDQVVGGAFVQSHGGRVVLIDLEEGFSTTKTIARATLPG